MTWLQLVLEALATFRITRLVVTDEITQPMRDWFQGRTRIEHLQNQITQEILATRYVRDPRRPVSWCLYRVTGCAWCTSVWVGAAVVGAWYAQPSVTIYVCAAAGASAVAGLISERG